MNPLIFYDYVYYKIAYFYENIFNYEEQNEIPGVVFLSLLQLLNVFTLFGLFYEPIIGFNRFNPLIIYFSVYFFIIILNIIRYKKIVTYTELEEKWGMKDDRRKLIKNMGIIIYIILTFVLFVGMLVPNFSN